MWRLGSMLGCGVLCAALAAACSPTDTNRSATIQVSPHTSTLTQPLSVRVHGLSPGSTVTVRLSSTDAAGVRWSSAATFRNVGSTLDLGKASAVSGSYRGVDPMGLVETLKPKTASTVGSYKWSGPQHFHIGVQSTSGTALGATSFVRQLDPTVHSTTQTMPRQGFDGEFYSPGSGETSKRRPAVLAFGGSEGGNQDGLLGSALASAGFPTLTVAYFDAPGLPKNLVGIPLEYFARALRWLRRQPDVDPRHVYIAGLSRGSEAAELVAVHYPNLVHGVVLGVPSGVVQQGLTGGLGAEAHQAGASAWSFRGRPVPFSAVFDDPDPLDRAAVIHVEDIRGPMFLVCGGADLVWGSCPFARAIVERLDAHRVRFRHQLLAYPDAGHFVGVFVPYQPSTTQLTGRTAGRRPWSNGAGLADAWPRLLRFLDTTSGQDVSPGAG